MWINNQAWDVLGYRRHSVTAQKLARRNGGRWRPYGSGYVAIVPANLAPQFRQAPIGDHPAMDEAMR
jgi:hypothetical protein